MRYYQLTNLLLARLTTPKPNQVFSSQRPFAITRRIEVGHLTETFFGPIRSKIFYVVLTIYLYGDLAIYAVSVPKSLAAVTGNFSIGALVLTTDTVYWFHLTIFAIVVTPFAFFDFQRTKYLQIFTMACRNIAFFTMIILALVWIAQGNATPVNEITWFSIGGLPELFGVAIYAFMCHHSIPGIISPIKNKASLTRLFVFDFSAVGAAYVGLCVTAMIAFAGVKNPTCLPYPGPACAIQELYTLNFASFDIRFFAYYLALFPVLTLTTNFPLIAITLRNNLSNLIPLWQTSERMRKFRRPLFALIVVIPPIIIAYATRNVQVLVDITGAYAGLGIMFLVPAFLVLLGRRRLQMSYPQLAQLKNRHASPFQHRAWVYAIVVWSVACLVFITVNKIYSAVTGHLL
eukprot:TRINITY_DN3003_c0_g1_i1.p1 TRINITY_DN3003_c0_g1~~TRINITY_DN3003_c0_g1_i1.p1  ORF type:complete len:403 (-),score=66.15 TRINITY_DN3003_c0_g1_i1:72-1280(-)